MASILGETITAWNEGRIEHAHIRAAPIEPDPGFDGVAVVSSGWVAEPLTVVTTTRVAGDIVAANAKELAYQRLQKPGRNVGTVVDQHGRSWPNCTVVSVRTTPLATESASVWHVRAEWLIVPPTVRPS